MSAGHLFVVHSRMENIQYDAAVVPTDDFLAVSRYWRTARPPTSRPTATNALVVGLRRPAWNDRYDGSRLSTDHSLATLKTICRVTAQSHSPTSTFRVVPPEPSPDAPRKSR